MFILSKLDFDRIISNIGMNPYYVFVKITLSSLPSHTAYTILAYLNHVADIFVAKNIIRRYGCQNCVEFVAVGG